MTYPSARYKALPPVQRLAIAKWACSATSGTFDTAFGKEQYLFFLSGLYLLEYANQLSHEYADEMERQRNFDYTKKD